jgi:hypothetical protein
VKLAKILFSEAGPDFYSAAQQMRPVPRNRLPAMIFRAGKKFFLESLTPGPCIF